MNRPVRPGGGVLRDESKEEEEPPSKRAVVSPSAIAAEIHQTFGPDESSQCMDFLPDFLEDGHFQDLNPYRSKSVAITAAGGDCQPDATLSNDEDDMMMIPSEQSVDALLAQDMAQLSVDEREEISFQLHGISTLQEDKETKESVQRGLTEFNRILLEQEKEATANPKGSLASSMAAYLLAKTKDGDYVQAEKFRLLFLRKARWDIPEAATAIYKHFTIKLELFREELLSKDILYSDLDERAQKLVYSGYVRVLPERDRGGRCVCYLSALSALVAEKDLPKPDDPSEVSDARCRALWYFAMCTLRDEDIQKKGIVLVAHAFGDVLPFYMDLKHLRRTKYIREGIPYTLMGAHFCHHNAMLNHAVNFIRFINGSDTRVRFRCHYSASLEEIKLLLGSYGIPAKYLPESIVDEETGEQKVSVEDHHKHCDQIREQEQMENASAIGVPRRFDVLFGRSGQARTHTGNYRCVHICEMHLQKYERISKFEKTEMAERIVSIIHESDGRFLKPTKYGWEEVDHDLARDKVAHIFRNLRKKQKRGSSSSLSSSAPSQSSSSIDHQEAEEGSSKPALAPEETKKLKRERAT